MPKKPQKSKPQSKPVPAPKVRLPIRWVKEKADIFIGEMVALRDDHGHLWARVEKYGLTGTMYRWIVELPDAKKPEAAGYSSDYATGQVMATLFLVNNGYVK